MEKHYTNGVLGGTFDHFHVGHKHFIDTAFKTAEHVTIGLAQIELYIHKPFSESIESYSTREKNLKKYLEEKGYLIRATIVPIHDVYGVTIDEDFDVIFVTTDTKKGGEIINTERIKRGLTALEVIFVDDVLEDDGEVSSERIRKGEIDENGNSYYMFFEKHDHYALPDSLRDELRKPAGEVVQSMNELNKIIIQDSFLVTVGDVVTSLLLKGHMKPAISIIDFKTRRHEEAFPELESFRSGAYTLKNQTGTINKEFSHIYKEAQEAYLSTKKSQVIIVEGEEDLLALPAMLFAPLNSYVIYGLFDVGMVVVKVTEKKKKYVKGLLKRFA